jgi:hypothetical protein
VFTSIPRITSMGFESSPPADPLDEVDFLEEVDVLEGEMRAINARLLERIGKLDEEWPDDPAVPDLASEMAARQRITATLAAERLRVARALRDLPHIRQAHAEGRLSWDQLRWVTRFVSAEEDEEWAQRAANMRPDALRLESQRQAKEQRREAERDQAMRSVWMSWDEDRRFLDLHATLAAEQGAAVESALKEAAHHVEVGEDVSDRKGARLADALVGLVTSSRGASSAPALVVHADAEVLAGADDDGRGLAETSSGVQLTPEAVRRLACEARIRLVLERDGRPAGMVTRGRAPTEHQTEMLRFRDRGCTFPGCGATWFLHRHHIQHWTDDGETALENLTLLCGMHHRKVHEGRWTIRGRPPDELEFVSPTGRVLSRAGPVMARAG